MVAAVSLGGPGGLGGLGGLGGDVAADVRAVSFEAAGAGSERAAQIVASESATNGIASIPEHTNHSTFGEQSAIPDATRDVSVHESSPAMPRRARARRRSEKRSWPAASAEIAFRISAQRLGSRWRTLKLIPSSAAQR